jgi:O-antigen ligase
MLIVLAGLAASVVQFGSPVSMTRRAYHAFTAPTQATGPDLNRRLFTFSGSGRIPLWHVAWRAYEDHPLVGLGAGGYARAWHERRPIQGMARDAHNLYLELLAELGPLGLGLLALAFAIPLAGIRRARRHPFAPAALATFVAYLAHAVADWDWEMPAVSLTALTCAAMLLVLARPEHRASMSPRVRALGLCALTAAGVLVLVTLVGNLALSSSVQAASEDRWVRSAAEAQRAARWIPWAAQPWQRLGEAELALGRTAQARQSFETALRKDARDWSIWLDLAAAATGAGERRALAEATRLNPLSPEIAAFRAGAAGTPFRAGG